MLNQDRRNPIKQFSANVIAEYLAGRSVLSAELFSSGKCNSNYKLTLDDGIVCVARFYNSGNSDRDGFVMDLARKIVPVPRELYRGNGWAILEFVKGKLLELVPEYSKAAGIAIAQFSSRVFDCPGRIEADGSISSFEFGGLQGFVELSMENPIVQEWLGSERLERLIGILNERRGIFEELDSQTHLVHGDFNPTNILVESGQLCGILDWEYALAGTPFMDIGNLLRNTDENFHEDIHEGLIEGGMDLPEDWKERAELVDLSSHFEFLTSTRSDEFKKQCLKRIDRHIKKYGPVV